MDSERKQRIVLHASWIPAKELRWSGALALWGEIAGFEGYDEKPDPNHPTGEALAHPGAATWTELRDWTGVDECRTDTLLAWLPTLRGIPVPSPEAGGMDERIQVEVVEANAISRLSPWRVTTLLLPVFHAFTWLVQLPANGVLHHTPFGTDLLHWRKVALLTLDTLVRERVIPGMRKNERQYEAIWRPEPSPECSILWKELERKMPEVARALPYVMEENLPILRTEAVVAPVSRSAGYLNQTFQLEASNGAIRTWLARGNAQRPKRGIGHSAIPMQRWAWALLSSDPIVDVNPTSAAQFQNTLIQWEGAVTRQTNAKFRVCFILQEPEYSQDLQQEEARTTNISTETGSILPGDDPAWVLSFHLQDRDDPSILVSAEEIWSTEGDFLQVVNRQFGRPQEGLLAELGRAARLYPVVTECLREAKPSSCTLTTEEAYQFLRETAQTLEEVGFGVRVPPWWERRSERPYGVKLLFKPLEDAPASTFGLNTVLDFDWRLAIGDTEITPDEFEQLAALKVPMVRVRGQWVEIRREQVEEAIGRWDRQRQHKRLTFADALRLEVGVDSPNATLAIVETQVTGWLSDFRRVLMEGETLQELPAPTTFSGELRPYQVRGFSWLHFLRQWGIGACLADDMGLGKTIQLIALLLGGRESGRDLGPTLLVCPTSVVGNWVREIQRFGPSLTVYVHHGPDRRHSTALTEAISGNELVITTYPLLHRDADDLQVVEWDGLVLDEAQNIKNAETKQARTARNLTSRYRVALTGTPVENRLSELWAIMEFLNPGFLGSSEDFTRRFAIPIERYQQKPATDRLHRLVQPFILRRLKSDPRIIQDLPEKQEMKVYCTLTREQATLYEAVVRELLERIDSLGAMQRRGSILATLTKLKQICNHPTQFLHDHSELPNRSGKLTRLTEMLEEVLSEGDRALIFTQYTEMGHLMQTYLAQVLDCEVIFLHGGVAQPKREEMIRHFQAPEGGPPLFILSLKAGGLGLNLTRANHVFHFDRWWNPAVENQATDRAFRIGQLRNVQVHKYICTGTLEDRIDEMIEGKQALADRIVGGGEEWLTELSTDGLRSLISLRTDLLSEEGD